MRIPSAFEVLAAARGVGAEIRLVGAADSAGRRSVALLGNEGALFPRAAETTAARATRLFRAVEGAELKDVLRYGDYNIHPNSTFKRFAFDEGSLDAFIKVNPGRNYTKTFIDLPTEKLDFMIRHGDPGGVGKAIGIDVFENPQFYDWFKGVNVLGPK
jgi:hypothetical protein